MNTKLEDAFEGVLKAQVALDAMPVQVTVELGRVRLTIRQVLELAEGSIIELNGQAGEPMNVFLDGSVIAQGQVIVVNDKFGIQLTDIVAPAERIRKLHR